MLRHLQHAAIPDRLERRVAYVGFPPRLPRNLPFAFDAATLLGGPQRTTHFCSGHRMSTSCHGPFLSFGNDDRYSPAGGRPPRGEGRPG